MSGLGELDRPGTPGHPGTPGGPETPGGLGTPGGSGAWDERSRRWPDRAPGPASDSVRAGSREGHPERRPGTTRRAGPDPVKALMQRHRALCERAVDPLEIAAGLEAHGVTDRTAAHFRHRDVFSLAEEMYARVPRDDEPPSPESDLLPGDASGHDTDRLTGAGDGSLPAAPTATPPARPGWIALTLLPGALCAATVAGLRLTHGQPRLITAAAGALAAALALRVVLRRWRPAGGPHPHTATWTSWLVGYALLGDGLLGVVLRGGPDALPTGGADGPWPVSATPALALALACAPALWCAHLFAVRARRTLATSRGLNDFTASVRTLLYGTFALFLCVTAALAALSGALLDQPVPAPQTLTLGALLFLARLTAGHGLTHTPALVLTGAATAEATALAGLFAGRLPGCGVLAVPVEALVTTWGPGSVPTAACGAGALTLLLHATRRLTRASAHADPEPHR
ncbi:hypothetical protein [Streptomyces ziwulingensis]|uniref:Integral membrane protein n=1 Tax=Streptomyces ziwulingensis TaxID=1045501 RepID=A0ABP9CXG5_9ACTN